MARQRSAALAAVSERPVESVLEGTPLTVGGRTVTVGKLTLDQWTALTLLAFETLTASNVPLPKSKAEAEEMAERAENISLPQLIRGLNAEAIARLYAILTDEPEDFLRETFDMVEFLDVLGAVGEHIRLREIASAFRRVVKRW